MLTSQILEGTLENHTRNTFLMSPDWSIIPSKCVDRRNDTIMLDNIKRLAFEQLHIKDTEKLKLVDERKIRLQAEYISDVSPNRKLIYKETQKLIRKQGLSEKNWSAGKNTLLYYLSKNGDSKSDKYIAQKHFPIMDGSYVTFPALTTGGYGVNVFSLGKSILSNIGDGWTYELTPEEWYKKQEFNKLYSDALQLGLNNDCVGSASIDGIIYAHEKFDVLT